MTIHRPLGLLLASVLATSAAAQSTSKPLNLKLPPGAVPATSGSAAFSSSSRTALCEFRRASPMSPMP